MLRAPLDFCAPTVSVNVEYIPCTDKDGNENRILIIYVPASPLLHANQADEVFWRVGDKSRKLSFEERLQLMYDKGERYFEDTSAFGAREPQYRIDSFIIKATVYAHIQDKQNVTSVEQPDNIRTTSRKHPENIRKEILDILKSNPTAGRKVLSSLTGETEGRIR